MAEVSHLTVIDGNPAGGTDAASLRPATYKEGLGKGSKGERGGGPAACAPAGELERLTFGASFPHPPLCRSTGC